MLEKEGKEKDGVIERMGRNIDEIKLKALEEADNIYKLKYSDQKSTAR